MNAMINLIRAAQAQFPDMVEGMIWAVAKDPKVFGALLRDMAEGSNPDKVAMRAAIVRALVTAAPMPQTQAPQVQTAPSPLDGRILTWMKVNNPAGGEKRFAPGDVRKGLDPQPSPNAFSDALKRLYASGDVLGEGHGAGRRIWLAPPKK